MPGSCWHLASKYERAQRSGVTLEQDCNNISQFSHTSAQASYSVPMGSDNNSSQHLHTLTSHLGGSWIRDDLHEVNEENHVLYITNNLRLFRIFTHFSSSLCCIKDMVDWSYQPKLIHLFPVDINLF